MNEEKKIREYFEIWWKSSEGKAAIIAEKEMHWKSFRAGFIRAVTDEGGKLPE